ncbi:MAG TPA: sigma-70 family RNA polymerase sigma factor [Thermoanaerobaculia bacterium]|jgi:RNA polymerase sigma-70 factor (ECF subfamily)|nr:sigma-70 family RNA polymerase sigma factor [Thermoanaerobaculia bacterium]
MVQGLIEQLQEGSSQDEAFRRLFDLYSPRLYHFFSRRGFSHPDCLDLTQEAFLGIYKGIGAFRRDASFETWLFKIATNAYRKRLRWGVAEKRGAPEVPLEGDQEDGGPLATLAATDVPAPGEEMLRRERALLLRQAIDRLPEQMRKCLLLRVDHEMRYKEVAVVLRLSPETVKVHLFQARRRLQEELGPYFASSIAGLEEGAP